jgi:pteridine reductase
LVTGGGVRIGACIVRELVGSGYRVWIHCRSSLKEAEALRAELPIGSVLGVLVADLAIEAERKRMVQSVLDWRCDQGNLGRLDLLVNSAASFEAGPFVERTDADLERVLATNLVAPMSLIRGLLPAMQRQGSTALADPPPPAASIVNIVDLGGLTPWTNLVDHCVAKAALVMATQALAVELPPIRVNAIAPGYILPPNKGEDHGELFAEDTNIPKIPLGKVGSPKDVAGTVRYLAGASYVTGQVLRVDGGHFLAWTR